MRHCDFYGLITICSMTSMVSNSVEFKIGVITEHSISVNRHLIDELVSQLPPPTSNSSVNIQLTWRNFSIHNAITASNIVQEMYLSGAQFIISVTSCRAQRSLTYWSRIYGLPHMPFSTNDCPTLGNHGDQKMGWTGMFKHLPSLISHLATAAKFDDVAILYDDAFAETNMLTTMVTMLTDLMLMTKIIQINSNQSDYVVTIGHDAMSLAMERVRHVILLVDSDKSLAVLKMAERLNITKGVGFYIILEDENSDLRHDIGKTTFKNVWILQRYLCQPMTKGISQETHQVDPLLPCNASVQMESFMDAVIADALIAIHDALIGHCLCFLLPNVTCNGEDGTESARKLERHQHDLELTLLTRCIVSALTSNCTSGYTGTLCSGQSQPMIHYDICDVHGSLQGFEHVGSWTGPQSGGTGFNLSDPRILLDTYYDFHGRELDVSALLLDPFVMSVGGSEYEGFLIDILRELSIRLNFVYSISVIGDNQFGSRDEHGNWSGVVGAVARGEASIGVAPFTVLTAREEVIDFTYAIAQMPMAMLTRRYEENSLRMFKVFIPFTGDVWGGIVGGVFAVTFLLMTANRLSPYSEYVKSGKKSSRDEITLGGNLWTTFMSFTDQGVELEPNSASSMCFLGFWFVFRIVIVAMYTANLVAFLTVDIPKPPLESIQELAMQDDVRPVMLSGTSHEMVFRGSENELYQKIWSMRAQDLVTDDHEEVLEAIRQTGKYAYLSDLQTVEYVASKECHTFVLAKKTFYPSTMALIISQEAPYRAAVDHTLQKMHEGGLIRKWYLKWWKKDSGCLKSSSTNEASILDVQNLAGPFIVFTTVAVLSVLALICEKLYFSRKVKKTREPKNIVQNNLKTFV